MDRSKNNKKSQFTAQNILLGAVGILLIVTLISTRLVSGLFAKYIVTENYADSSTVAGTGIEGFELLEHTAIEYPGANSGVYTLKNDRENKNNPDKYGETTENLYGKVLPGVDIPKDPFVRLEINNSAVDYELYIQVTESKNFPAEYVTYEIRDDLWECIDSVNNIYKYKGYFYAGEPYSFTDGNEIYILKNDTLYVSEHFVGNGNNFTLSFDAWLKQVL